VKEPIHKGNLEVNKPFFKFKTTYKGVLKRFYSVWVGYLVVAGIIMTLSSSDAYAGKVQVGEPPPTFVLIDDNGKKVNLDEFIDKPTVIYFTHNACHYCTQIIAMLKRADKEFSSDNLLIMGVNVMAKDQKLIRAYKEELGFVFPMFAGNRSDVLAAYKINYVPKLIFIDAQKIVRKIVGHYIHELELYEIIREIVGPP
jgi:peroxiredoxin